MSHKITVEIPDSVYGLLRRKALHRGRSLEEMVVDWIKQVARESDEDPLMALAGTLDADVADISSEHDAYLGRGLGEKLARSEGE